MSLLGVQRALQVAESTVSPSELYFDVDLEQEDHTQEIWNSFSPISADNVQAPAPVNEQFLANFVVEVAEGTDDMYRTYVFRPSFIASFAVYEKG